MRTGFFSSQETSELLEVHPSTLRSWESNGVIPAPERGYHGIQQRREIPFSSLQIMAARRLERLDKLPFNNQSRRMQFHRRWLVWISTAGKKGDFAEWVADHPLSNNQVEKLIRFALRWQTGHPLRASIFVLLGAKEACIALNKRV